MGRLLITGLVCAAAGLAGCLPVSNYHSAKTLGAGESSWGLTFSSTTYTDTDSEGNQDSVSIPGVIPEVAYHIGLNDDVEVGGRVAPGFLYGEIDVKYRFVQADRLHMAIAPAIGQMAVGFTLTTIRLPLILTYEISDSIAFNAGINATNWRYARDSDSSTFEFYSGDDAFVTSGGFIGFEITGKTAFFRPSLELGTMVTDPGGDAERLTIGALVLHFGWVSGREMKKLEEMDEKLDRIEQRMGDNWNLRRNTVASSN